MTVTDHDGPDAKVAERQFDIRMPNPKGADYDQDEEWCEVHLDGGEVRRMRLHDYGEIYEIPGLYEQIFYTELRCDSPRTISSLLDEALEKHGTKASDLRVLDVGAGNGMVGEELDKLGVDSIVGADIIEEAAEACERDRPGVYDDYYVVDLTDVPEDVQRELEARRFNCLATVAALGFGDIPPEAFKTAYDLVDEGGWIAFNIKEAFINEQDRSGFSDLVDRALEAGAMRKRAERTYRHRFSLAGEPLHYVAVIAEKLGPLDI